ncbi:cilia- and flagella-associated protein 61-like [Hermetia illucens]|uniref:cilia- and flagella-associated protein 61-like n=1 Tax=Hermetia illucens TaxID=343691 RepID=UPI0018CC52A9|nr:cilia- and flagella-associated protein 61-like [Hermetia illucens]
MLDENFGQLSYLGPSRDRLVSKSTHSMHAPSKIEGNDINAAHQWREATIEDLPFIKNLVDDEVREFFGDVYLASLIELCPHSVVIEDVSRQIVGFLCLNNYPNISALSPEVWTDWMKHHYKLTELQYQNTLFVHYIVWKNTLRSDCLHAYLEDLFLNCVKLEYVCLVAPANDAGISFVKNSFIKMLFSRALPFGSFIPMKTQSLHICFRSSLVAKMKIRRALPEDNDDLVEILDATAPKLRNYYGDFYIAEIVTKHEPNRSIIVAEINNQTVGMMCLNTNVDLEKLNQNFQLIPFHALRKYRFNMAFDEMEVREIVARESQVFFAGMNNADDEDDEMTFTVDTQYTVPSQTTQGSQIETEITKDERSNTNLKKSIPESEEAACTLDIEVMAEWQDVLKTLADRDAYYQEFTRQVKLPQTDPNVMAIELFGISAEVDERSAIDLLKAAFDTYRDRDYCLLTIPTTAYLPSFLNYFTVENTLNLPPNNSL